MERESNQLEAGPVLCRMGCGFFGSANTDGLCSKCHKDALKKKQMPPPGAVTSPSTSSAAQLLPPQSFAATALPTIPIVSQVLSFPSPCETSFDEGASGGAELGEGSGDGEKEDEGGKKKKNKCHMCKKKVGLTGFACRCGGLFCSVHRYSNEHQCTFDYRVLGAEEIRRNNPVIKGEKIQKI